MSLPQATKFRGNICPFAQNSKCAPRSEKHFHRVSALLYLCVSLVSVCRRPAAKAIAGMR